MLLKRTSGSTSEVFSIRRAAGKLKFLAGSESAMGAFVNDITPEVAAERLRSGCVRPDARSGRR